MKLTCTKCGLIFEDIDGILQEIALPSGGSHLKCSCPGCERYVKFLSHAEPKLYFGKYKGKTIKEVAKVDMDYLKWLLTQDIGGNKIGDVIRKTIQEN